MLNVSDAAKAYNNLHNFNYELIVVKNRNMPKVKIVLEFDKSKFYHLCGLHDLKIKSLQSLPREDVFDGIIDNTYEDSFFQKNKNFTQIEDRIATLIRLEEMLDSNDTIFKFNLNTKGSDIECDYIIKNQKDGRNYYYMISETNEGKFFGRSCFNRDSVTQKDFSIGHAFYNILYKAKLTLDEQKNEIGREELFVADSFRKELEKMQEVGEIKRPISALSSVPPTLTDNPGSGTNNTQKFSIQPLRRQLFDVAQPVFSGQAASDIALPFPSNQPPLFDISKIIIALQALNEKITNAIHTFTDSFSLSHAPKQSTQEQPPQARTAHERKVNSELPFPKQKPADERTEPVTAKQEKARKPEVKPSEKQSSWIGNLISSARSESDAHNKNHEPKAHDKDKSL